MSYYNKKIFFTNKFQGLEGIFFRTKCYYEILVSN
jgi:hypothetical protein